MLYFLFGMITGGALGVAFMCLFQVDRTPEWDGLPVAASVHPDPEKTAVSGVDNTAKKG